MATKWRFISLALIFILPLGVTFMSRDATTAPNSAEVVCQLGTISTPLRDRQPNNNIVLPIYLTNISDSIVGFTLWVRSAWPELLRFGVASQQGEVIYAKFDTVGTLSRGFKFFSARIQDGLHGQVKISAICDPDSPRVVKPIPPGSGILLKLIMETTNADSICDSMPTHMISLQFDRYQTSFSNPAGQTIGCNYVLVVDTTHPGGCKVYAPPPKQDSCIAWWDTVYVERLRCVSIDTTKRVLIDGSHTFNCVACQCGDANNSGAVNISDAVFLIAYIFAGGTAPGACGGNPNGMGDANGSGAVNISDAVYLIAYIFAGGTAPRCQ